MWGLFRGVSKIRNFTLTIGNNHLQWLILQTEAGRQGVSRRGRNWDICLGVTQRSRVSFFCWWQMPRSRPLGHQRFEGMSSQTGPWGDFVSGRAVHLWAIKSVTGRKYVFLYTSGKSFVSCLEQGQSFNDTRGRPDRGTNRAHECWKTNSSLSTKHWRQIRDM